MLVYLPVFTRGNRCRNRLRQTAGCGNQLRERLPRVNISSNRLRQICKWAPITRLRRRTQCLIVRHLATVSLVRYGNLRRGNWLQQWLFVKTEHNLVGLCFKWQVGLYIRPIQLSKMTYIGPKDYYYHISLLSDVVTQFSLAFAGRQLSVHPVVSWS